MDNIIVACVQPRMSIPASREEFEAGIRRFMRQAQAKGAQLVILPELTGVMLAPPLISQFKLGLIKRADQGSHPKSGLLSRGLGRFTGATAGAMGGGLPGSLKRLLRKKGNELEDLYLETFGDLAREYGTTIVGGSLYINDAESGTVRHRAYVFDPDGSVLGYQDKFNLTSDERELATPGADLAAIETRVGRLGLLIGRDVLYPELSRLLAIQGVDLLAGIAATAGAAQSDAVRSALSVRAEENQVYAAAVFMLGPNHIDRSNSMDYYGRSALLAPISLTDKGNSILVQAGTNRTETLIATELAMDELYSLRETSRFQPRREMHLGHMGPILADMYRDGLTVEQAIEGRIAGPVAPLPEQVDLEPALPSEPEPVEGPSDQDLPEPEAIAESVPESMSLTRASETDASRVEDA